MKITDTISVNPGKTALGHVDTSASSFFRTPVIGSKNATQSFSLVNVIFPSVKTGTEEYRKYDVPLRTIFATILIITGLSVFTFATGIHSLGFAVCSLVFGALLALGFLTRPIMLGAAVFYCICGALSIRSGAADISSFSLMFGCLVFGVIGSGKYSCDTLIRKFIHHQKRVAYKKRKENLMGYKAFHSVKI